MKKPLHLLLALTAAVVLSGCAGSKPAETTTAAAVEAATETTAEETAADDGADKADGEHAEETAEDKDAADEAADKASADGETGSDSDVTIRVGSLKGPTSMGLVQLMNQQETGEAAGSYEFTMVTAADELLGKVVSGDLDIALIPANVASVLYNKTQGGISVIDINTLGVLYVVASDDSIQSMADLKDKTVYLTGKGTTPDYVFRYLLSENGLTDQDVTLEFKSESAEVAAILKEQPEAIAVLPQPFVTAACAQNENLSIALNLTEEWQAVQGESGSQLVTGVTVVRNAFLQEYPEAVDTFLQEHAVSSAFANEQPEQAAQWIADAGIIEKAPIAQKALPYCNITCITGEDMKAALSGYLQVLADQDASAVGGKLPGEDFYYIP